MRLNAILPADLATSLEQCGIRTDTDLLFSDNVFRRLPPGTISLHELTKTIALVAEKASAPGTHGDHPLPRETRRHDDLTCGVPDLDGLLGGFGGSRVFEISGDQGSGKTCLALHVVLRHLVDRVDSGALWMDTTGELSPERLVQSLSLHDGQAASTVLERLQVSLAFDVEAVHDVLDGLRSELCSGTPSRAKIRCVVIDCITPLFGPLLSAVSAQGHAIMTTFMRQLRALARGFEISIFVINNTTTSTPHNPQSAFGSTVRKPALGPSFTFLTDATLWLARTPATGDSTKDGYSMHVAEVFRSKATRSKCWCTFGIRHGHLVSATP